MKARHVLYLATIAGILMLALAAPVLADVIPMSVDRIRMIQTGLSSSTKGRNDVAAMIRIVDEDGEPVVGALVRTEWTLPNEETADAENDTCSQGVASVFVPLVEPGTYEMCVASVEKDGWLYEPDPQKECAVLSVR
jgi:hypothetical protein